MKEISDIIKFCIGLSAFLLLISMPIYWLVTIWTDFTISTNVIKTIVAVLAILTIIAIPIIAAFDE